MGERNVSLQSILGGAWAERDRIQADLHTVTSLAIFLSVNNSFYNLKSRPISANRRK